MKFPENVCKILTYILHFVNIIVKQTICPQKQCPKGMKTLDKPCTLVYRINVGYQINVGLGILFKNNRRRVSNKCRLGNFCYDQ